MLSNEVSERAEVERRILRAFAVDLKRDVIPIDVLPYLLCLTEDDCEQIQHKQDHDGPRAAVPVLLDKLKKRVWQGAFKEFLTALGETGCSHLKTSLENALRDQTHQPEPQHNMTQETTPNLQSKIVKTPTTETLKPSYPDTKQSIKPTPSKKSNKKLKLKKQPREHTTSLPESKPLDSQSADTKEASPPYVKLKVAKATRNTPPKQSGVSQRLLKSPPITKKEEDPGKKISTPNPTCTQSPASTDPTSNSQPAETDPTENSKIQYDTLLCYAKEDCQIALELKQFLETKCGLQVCIGLENFIPGKPTTDNISESINSSGSVIFLLSPEFLKKMWAPWELKHAVHDFNASQKNGKQKKIIPVLLKECQVPDELKMYEPIKMEAYGSQKHCWKKLAAAILDRPYSDDDSDHGDSGDDDNDYGDDDHGDDDALESQGEKNKGDVSPQESQEAKNKDDVLPPESQGETNKDDVLPPEAQVETNRDDILPPPEPQGEKYKAEIDDTIIDLPEYSGQTSDNSITIDQEGGCFSLPEVSAILQFPPQVVKEQVTLTYRKVNFKECEVKPKDGELLVSGIFKIEPEGVTFKKPVTVFLSHSVYEDQVFMDFYELIVENLSLTGWEDLKTEQISSSKDIPGEICNPEMFDDYLPIVKATISATCTLVAAARVRSDRISIPTNKNYIFSKRYGKNAELKITFPAGVTEEISNLKVQLFPADAILNKDVHLDKNLVCAPVIKVSGQTTPFLKAVDVELTYSNDDVANIDEEFLPVGNKFKFTTGYGLLLGSQKKTESKSECQTLNENNDVFIERPRKDQLKFSFSLKHFCKLSPIVMKNGNVNPPNIQDNSVFNSSLSYNLSFTAIALAVHDREENTFYAILAGINERVRLKKKWKIDVTRIGPKLKDEQKIYYCVPLKKREEKDDNHLRLHPDELWFNREMEHTVPNKTSEDVHDSLEYMYLWLDKCTGENHDSNKEVIGKIKIHDFVKTPEKENNKAVSETSSNIAPKPANAVSSTQRVAQNGHVTSQNEKSTESHEVVLDSQSLQGRNVSSDQEDAEKNSNKMSEVIMRRCELFEETVEIEAQKKLKINKALALDPKGGKATKFMNAAGPVAAFICCLAGGITINVATFGAVSFATALVVGVPVVIKIVDKHKQQANAKVVENMVATANVSSYINCILKEVAKELPRMFEYQLFQLKNDEQVKILAKCAVELMLDLKKGDSFDRNTLLKKVLRDGSIGKQKILTRMQDIKWSAPNVFQKPDLRRMIFGKDGAKFMYLIKQNACRTSKYGYRGEFLEMLKPENYEDETTAMDESPPMDETHNEYPSDVSCKECSKYENCPRAQYFGGSDIDSQYNKDLSQDEILNYYPMHPTHVLIQCPNVLNSFNELQEKKPSLTSFLKSELGIPENHLVRPVYRPHSPAKVPDLQKADLTGSDFSHSDFAGSCLRECNFTRCVMLFAKLTRATMCRSEFCKTLISHSNLKDVDASYSIWTETSILYSRVDRMDLRGMGRGNYGGIKWEGTNHDKAIKDKPTDFNEVNHSTEVPREAQSTVRPERPISNHSNPREARSTVRSESMM